MPYSESARPAFLEASEVDTYSDRAAAITPGASDALDPDGNYFKYVTLGDAGTITFVPYRNDDGATITMALQGGQVVPGRVRRVTSSTATVFGWYD